MKYLVLQIPAKMFSSLRKVSRLITSASLLLPARSGTLLPSLALAAELDGSRSSTVISGLLLHDLEYYDPARSDLVRQIFTIRQGHVRTTVAANTVSSLHSKKIHGYSDSGWYWLHETLMLTELWLLVPLHLRVLLSFLALFIDRGLVFCYMFVLLFISSSTLWFIVKHLMPADSLSTTIALICSPASFVVILTQLYSTEGVETVGYPRSNIQPKNGYKHYRNILRLWLLLSPVIIFIWQKAFVFSPSLTLFLDINISAFCFFTSQRMLTNVVSGLAKYVSFFEPYAPAAQLQSVPGDISKVNIITKVSLSDSLGGKAFGLWVPSVGNRTVTYEQQLEDIRVKVLAQVLRSSVFTCQSYPESLNGIVFGVIGSQQLGKSTLMNALMQTKCFTTSSDKKIPLKIKTTYGIDAASIPKPDFTWCSSASRTEHTPKFILALDTEGMLSPEEAVHHEGLNLVSTTTTMDFELGSIVAVLCDVILILLEDSLHASDISVVRNVLQLRTPARKPPRLIIVFRTDHSGSLVDLVRLKTRLREMLPSTDNYSISSAISTARCFQLSANPHEEHLFQGQVALLRQTVWYELWKSYIDNPAHADSLERRADLVPRVLLSLRDLGISAYVEVNPEISNQQVQQVWVKAASYDPPLTQSQGTGGCHIF